MAKRPARKETDILKRSELFEDLDDEVLRRLASRAIEKRLEKDEVLFIAGEPASGLYVIAEGSVRAFRSWPDGREQVIHVEKAVTTIAEVPVFDGGNFPSTVAAEEATTVLYIPREAVREICLKHPQLALAAARLLARRLRGCAELVESLSLREVGQRLAQLILKEANSRGTETPDGLSFEQRLTHNQLAARLGTVREVVTRSLYRLQTQGLVHVHGKKVTVPDIDALRSYVDS